MPIGPILVVDDEPANLAALNQVLSGDYRVVFARTGEDALLAVEKHSPSLILLDVQMPGLSGYDVCKRLKQSDSRRDIPIIFVTSLNDTGHETYGFALGAVDYITKPISSAIVKARVRTHLSLVRNSKLERSYRDAISMLGAAGHYNDTDTGVHIWRMAAYAQALAQKIGWNIEMSNLLGLAAPMHDTGKIGTPDAILKKPGPLNEEEWVIMRAHTTIGYGILSQSTAPIFIMAAEIALRHHEKWDGTGYPDGLKGEMIPESARIVAVADVFDALTIKRPYKEAWPVSKAIDTIISGSGFHFEPRLVEVFQEIIPEIENIKKEWDTKEDGK